MRPIIKMGAWGNFALRHAHITPPTDAAEASLRWGGLASKADLLTNYLLPEQYHLCCYSELDAERLGIGFHIEHVENKSQVPARTFDYANLAASAFSSDVGLPVAARQDWEVFGGHAPGKQGHATAVDLARFVSPFQPDCAKFFAYLSSGQIEPRNGLTPKDDDRAQYTIDLLNLNSPFLVSLRREWWDDLDQHFSEHSERGWSLVHLASVDLSPKGGRLSRFFSLTRQFFGPVAEEALRVYAPELA